jgi:hypothetical protein
MIFSNKYFKQKEQEGVLTIVDLLLESEQVMLNLIMMIIMIHMSFCHGYWMKLI